MQRNVMRRFIRDNLIDATFLAPAAIFFIIFVLIPFIEGIPMAFYSWDGFSPNKEFVGLKNFINTFTDPYIFNALKNTLEFTGYTVVLSNLLGLILALAVEKTTRTNSVLRTIFFMPFVISLVLSAFIWSYIYSDVLYSIFKIPSPLGDSSLVIIGLAVISIWRDAGYCMIIYVAALQAVPKEFYEAAKVEGAGAFRRFFSITLPMIVPAFTANVTLLLAWGLKVFDYPMAATLGGPGRASETLAMYVYNNVFAYHKAGYGQAVAIVMTIFIFIASSSVAKALRKKEVEL